MEILQGLIPILVAISLGCRADKTKKTSKADVKRDVGYGIQAIPGVAVHAPLASHGGAYPAGVVPQLGFISNTHALDNLGGFTSHGGYGVYPIIATPVVNVQGNVKGGHQLDQGWRGIPSSGYGSVKHGYQIAQSLSKSSIPVQENQYDVPIYNFLPAGYNDVKGRQASTGYNHNTLVPAYHISGLTANGKDYGPISADGRAQVTPVLVALHPSYQGHPIVSQGTAAPKGFTFSTYHSAPAPVQKGYSAYPVNHHIPGHKIQQISDNQVNHQFGHKAHLGSSGHGSINHGHQIAKTVHFPKPQHKHHNSNSYNPSQRSTFSGASNGYTKHNTPGAKKISSGNSYQNYHRSLSEPKKLTSDIHYNNYQHVDEQPSYRHSSSNHHDQVPAHLYTSDAAQQHDSSSYASAYTSDYNRDASPQQHSTSLEQDSGYHPAATGHTNGHGGGQYTSGDQKATSYQSFVIHTYPTKKQQNDQYNQNNNHESEENYSANNKYDSGRATSAESQYQN